MKALYCFKRLFCFASVMAVLFSLVGCGGDSDDSNANAPEPIANVAPSLSSISTVTVSSSDIVTISVNATDDSGINSYSWVQTQGRSVDIVNPQSASMSIDPSSIVFNETLVFQVTVTDNEGLSSTENATVIVDFPEVATAPINISSGEATQMVLPLQVLRVDIEASLENESIIRFSNEEQGSIEVQKGALEELFFIVPEQLEAGSQSFRANVNSTIYVMDFEVDKSLVPEDTQEYLSNTIDDLSNKLRANYAETPSSVTQLVEGLEAFKQEISSLSDSEKATLATLFSSNKLESTIASEPLNFAGRPLSELSFPMQLTSTTCDSAIVTAAVSLGFTVIFGNMAAGSSYLGPLAPKAVLAFGAGAAISFGGYLISANDAIEICPRRKANEQIVVGGGFLERSMPSELSSTRDSVNYVNTKLEKQVLNLFDGGNNTMTLTLESFPFEAMTQQIEGVIGILNSTKDRFAILTEIIDSMTSTLTKLVAPEELEFVDGVTLSVANTSAFNCSGDLKNFVCQFVEPSDVKAPWAEEAIDFSISAMLDNETEQFNINSRLLPRDVPFIPEQSADVKAGSGITNLVKIKYVEDKAAETYELTKVLGFDIVSSPEYGVILNDFNENSGFDAFEYAADIQSDMPEQTQLSIRAWNRYGWSNEAKVTLNLSVGVEAFDLVINSVITKSCFEDEPVGQRATDPGVLELYPADERAILRMDIEGDGNVVPFPGSYNVGTGSLILKRGIDSWRLNITSKNAESIDLKGTVTASDPGCNSIWSVSASGTARLN